MWQCVTSVPSSATQFGTLQMDFATHVVGIETNHQSARVGPWLRSKISDVCNLETNFFADLTAYSLFKCFACFHESCNKSIVIASEIIGMDEQHLFVFSSSGLGFSSNEHDDGSSKLRPYFLSTLGASL